MCSTVEVKPGRVFWMTGSKDMTRPYLDLAKLKDDRPYHHQESIAQEKTAEVCTKLSTYTESMCVREQHLQANLSMCTGSRAWYEGYIKSIQF
eukprot:2419238-Pleurochrysis_carterae.AAC.5